MFSKRLLLIALLVSAVLLLQVKSLTPEELGTVTTVNGVPCRLCILDCEASPLLKNCKSRYYQYGCHINQYCLTVNTATSREFFAGLSICMFKNGCELVTTNERTLLNATSEGRLDLQMRDYVAAQTSLATDVNIYKLQGEVYANYYSQISAIEAGWINNADKLTEGKRKAFQLINVSPSFFLLQDLMNTMFNTEVNRWKPVCDSLGSSLPMQSSKNFFVPLQSEVRTAALLGHCSGFRSILEGMGFNETQFLQSSYNSQKECRTRAMYLYVYRHICALPSEFITTARLADQLVDDSSALLTDKLFLDFTSTASYRAPNIVNGQVVGVKTVQSVLPKIQDLFVAIQTFAFNYLNIMQSNSDEATKQSSIETISQALLEKSPLCDGLYCTYLCKDYAYDIATKLCDVYDDTVTFIRKRLGELCKVVDIKDNNKVIDFSYTAVTGLVKLRENLPELKYCRTSERAVGRTMNEACLMDAMSATINTYMYKYKRFDANGNSIYGSSPSVGSFSSFGITIDTEVLTTEKDFMYAKYSSCSGTVCSRAQGCDILYSDLVAIRQYFDINFNWLDGFMYTYNLAWKQVMNPQPKMVVIFGTDTAFWFRTLSPLTNAWSEWVSLGGSFKAPATAVALDGGVVLLLGWYNDNTLRYRKYANGQWNAEGWISLGGSLESKPAVSVMAGVVRVFTTSGQKLYYRQYDGTTSTWSAENALDGSVASAPVVANMAESMLFAFVRRTDSSVAYRALKRYPSTFENWVNLGGNIIGEPASAMLGDGSLYTFVRGSDNGLWYNVYQYGQWFTNSWQQLFGTITSNPATVVFGESKNRLLVFARGTDSAIWYRLYQNSAWEEWQSIGGTVGAGNHPVAVVWDPSRVAVFARFSDYHLYYKVFKGTQWSSWISLDGGTVGETVALSLKN